MVSDKIIGGEFDIDINHLSGDYDTNFLNEGYLYSSGRAALYNILVYTRENHPHVQSLFLPDYLCHSIIDVVLKVGIRVKFYALDEQFKIDKKKLEDVWERGSAILLINYFGLQVLTDQVAYLRNLDENVCIIEDNVQGFFSMFEESDADFRFTSFRKILPVPDGGWVKTKYKINMPVEENSFVLYKAVGGVLKSFRKYGHVDDHVYLNLFEKGEKLIDYNLDKKISDFTINLFAGIDIKQIATLRKRNAARIVAGLKTLGIDSMLPCDVDLTPLFVPVLLEERDVVRRFFFDHHVFCPVHWPVRFDLPGKLAKGHEMAGRELSLVIDQRYDLDDMDRVLEILDCVIHGK